MPGARPGMTKKEFHASSRARGQRGTEPLYLTRLMDDRFLPQARDFVLYMQLASFQFCNLKVIYRRVGQRIADFLLERLMAPFKFRKVRFNRHVACLRASD
jgi:hypothetical protein